VIPSIDAKKPAITQLSDHLTNVTHLVNSLQNQEKQIIGNLDGVTDKIDNLTNDIYDVQRDIEELRKAQKPFQKNHKLSKRSMKLSSKPNRSGKSC
jgi:peptidoglycan hydrolase CwlO-like protein